MVSNSTDSELSQNAILVVDVGNSSTALGAWDAGKVSASSRIATGDEAALGECVAKLAPMFNDGCPSAVAVASVVPSAATWLCKGFENLPNCKVLFVGADLDLPIDVAVREPERVGVDRICAAAAAFDRTKHSCTVIDFGTAITIDLVDDQGVFAGGAILPGAALQAKALAEWTAALPLVVPELPEQAIGLDTEEAIRSGIGYGIPGAVRALVEQYATSLNTWPQVVGTGGGLLEIMARCDFIDTAVPDLTLMGVGLAYARDRMGAET